MNKVRNHGMVRGAGRLPAVVVFILMLLLGTARMAQAGNLIPVSAANVSASSYMTPYGPERAVDGSTAPASRWVCAKQSGVTGQWLQVNLGGTYRIDNIVVMGMASADNAAPYWTASYNIQSYVLQRSLDGTNFYDTSIPFTASHVRIRVSTGNGLNNKWAAITELKIYGTTNPAVTTGAAPASVGVTAAVAGGNVTSLGNDTAVERGVVYSTNPANLTLASGTAVPAEGTTATTGPFTVTLSGLQANTTYYYKAYVTNAFGTAYGDPYSFTTGSPPALAVNTGLTVNKNSPAVTVTNALLKATDPEQGAAALTFTVGTAPAKGTLKKSGSAVTAGGTFTQADIDNNLITYTPNTNTTGSDSFSFTFSDGTAGGSVNGSFAINIIEPPPPTLVISAPSASLTRSGPVTYTITYTGADTVTLANGNVTLNKTGTANGNAAVSGTGVTSRTVTISGITGDGTLGISIAAGTASNGGTPAATAGPSQTFAVDNTTPSVAFTPSNGATGAAVNVTPVISFDEAVRNIDGTEITDANVASLLTFKKENAGGADIAFTAVIDAGKTRITITPTGALDYSQAYYLALAPVEDAADNATTAAAATFTTAAAPAHIVSVSVSPPAGGTVSGGGSYAEGASVTVTATPNSGYNFVNWTENGTEISTDVTYTFNMGTINRTLVANFAVITHNISVSANPAAGGTVTGGGSYAEGAAVTVTATANSGYNFVNWTEGGTEVSTSATYTFTLNTTDRTLVANYAAITHSVSVSANPPAGGTVSGGGSYVEGATVTVTATANSGYNFVNWTENGTEVSTDATYNFNMETTNRTLVANYAAITHSVSVLPNPAAGGTVSGGGSYDEGTSVMVTATANSGYKFVNWTENGTEISTDATYNFNMGTTDRTLVANFAAITHSVSVSANPSEGGTVTGGSTYAEGDSVTVTATSSSGYNFVNWTEGGTEVSTDTSYTFTLGTSDRILVANFTPAAPATHTVGLSANLPAGGTVSGGGCTQKGLR